MDKVVVIIAAAAQAAAGCYWPVPDCNERTSTTTLFPRSVTLQGDGAFGADGASYASCTDFCRAEPGVKAVLACEGPTEVTNPYNDTTYWKVRCDVQALVCDEQEIVGHLGSGRLTEGIVVPRATARTVGAYFAHVAALEAAAVRAFERMIVELVAHGAPADLVSAARVAADDERRHTRIARALARRFGSSAPALPEGRARAIRELEAIAIENAVEGCVREMAGAALVTFQAHAAAAPYVQRALRAIAADEVAHAGLSWRVHDWLETQLTPASRRRVHRALIEAAQSLDARELSSRSPVLRHVVGLPRNENADAMVGVLRGFSRLRLPSGRR